MTPPPVRISVNKDPVKPCESYVISYDFSGLDSSITSVGLAIDYGNGSPQSVTVHRGTNDQGSITVTVPQNAVSVTIADTSGNSEQLAVGLDPSTDLCD